MTEFSVNIIPYTLRETMFSEFRRGREVNIECDIIGKYVEKMLSGAERLRRGFSCRKKAVE